MWWKPRIELIAVVILAFASALQAQESRKTGQGDKPNRLGNPQWALELLQTELVQKEIRLTDEQKKELESLKQEFRRALRKYSTITSHTSPEEREKMYIMQGEIPKSFAERIERILLPGQYDRLWEIMLQMSGPRLLDEPGVAEVVIISDEQQDKIKSILEDNERRNDALITELGFDRPQLVSPEWHARKREMHERMRAIDKDARDKIVGVLTSEQRKQLGKMTGKDIDAKKLDAQALAISQADDNVEEPLSDDEKGSYEPLQ